MQTEDRKDFWAGFLYFMLLALCFSAFIKLPDGDPLLYKFLGLFGIPPGIQIGRHSTLYIYALVPLTIGFLCASKALMHWWRYGERFKAYKFFRYFPLVIIICLVLINANINTIYFETLRLQGGLKAVLYYSDNEFINFQFENNEIVYDYNLTLENLNDEAIEFQVEYKLEREFYDGKSGNFVILDDNENPKIFKLYPHQRNSFSGEFREQSPHGGSGGGAQRYAAIVLSNGGETQTLKPIKQ